MQSRLVSYDQGVGANVAVRDTYVAAAVTRGVDSGAAVPVSMYGGEQRVRKEGGSSVRPQPRSPPEEALLQTDAGPGHGHGHVPVHDGGYEGHEAQQLYQPHPFSESEQYPVHYSLGDAAMLDDVLMPSSDFRYASINSLNVDFCASFHDGPTAAPGDAASSASGSWDRYPSFAAGAYADATPTNVGVDPQHAKTLYLPHAAAVDVAFPPGQSYLPEHERHPPQRYDEPNPGEGNLCSLSQSSFDCIPLDDLTFRDDVQVEAEPEPVTGTPTLMYRHHAEQAGLDHHHHHNTQQQRHHHHHHNHHEPSSSSYECNESEPTSSNCPVSDVTARHADELMVRRVAATVVSADVDADADDHIRFVVSIPKKRKLPDAVREALNLFSPREPASSQLCAASKPADAVAVDDDNDSAAPPAAAVEAVLGHNLTFLPCADVLDDLPDLGDFEIAQLMSTMRKKKGVGLSAGKPLKPILDLPKKRLRGESFLSEFPSSAGSAAVDPDPVDAPRQETEPTLPHKKRIPKSLISAENGSDVNSSMSFDGMMAEADAVKCLRGSGAVGVFGDELGKDDPPETQAVDSRNENGVVVHPKRSRSQISKSAVGTGTGAKKNFRCPRCSEIFFSRHSLRAHDKTHTAAAFSCQLCGRDFVDQSEFYVHLKTHYEKGTDELSSVNVVSCAPFAPADSHRSDGIDDSGARQSGDGRRCRVCQEVCGSAAALEKHMCAGHESCSRQESDPNMYSDWHEHAFHVENVDGGAVGFGVPEDRDVVKVECNSEMLPVADAESPVQLTNTAQPQPGDYPCPECDARFVFKQRLGKHTKKAHGMRLPRNADASPKKKAEIGKPCRICGTLFANKSTLYYHMKRHAKTVFECVLCPKSFSTGFTLKAHLRTHTGEKPYVCDLCGLGFRQLGDLKYHKTSLHSDLRKFKCEFCGKDFARKYSYVVHRKIHTGEKSHKCDVCGKGFRAASYLQTHYRVHTGEKPFGCPVCGKRFRLNSDMKRHVATHAPASAPGHALVQDPMAPTAREPGGGMSSKAVQSSGYRGAL